MNDEIGDFVILQLKKYYNYSISIVHLDPLMLIAAKSRLTILMIFYRHKQSQENIWRRNVVQNITYNSPATIL